MKYFLIFLSTISFSQNILKPFEQKINFEDLDYFVQNSNDTIKVNNLEDGKLFHYYKNNQKLFANGFEKAYPFVGKSAIVQQNNKWGLIDQAGNFIFLSATNHNIRFTSYEKYVFFDDNPKIMYNQRSGSKQTSFIICGEPTSPYFYIWRNKNLKYQLFKRMIPIKNTEADSIITKDNIDNIDNLVILKNNNKYGLYLAEGNEILKIKYDKIQFLGNYIMVFEDKKWNYYQYKDKLNLITTSENQCESAAYQKNIIGVFRKENRYCLLKTNGETKYNFEFISPKATYAIDKDTVLIFNSKGEFYKYLHN